MSRPFRANFPGDCTECGADWDQGDLIGYNSDDELVCADCHRNDDIFADFDERGEPHVYRPPARKPKPEPRQPFQGTTLDDMGF